MLFLEYSENKTYGIGYQIHPTTSETFYRNSEFIKPCLLIEQVLRSFRKMANKREPLTREKLSREYPENKPTSLRIIVPKLTIQNHAEDSGTKDTTTTLPFLDNTSPNSASGRTLNRYRRTQSLDSGMKGTNSAKDSRVRHFSACAKSPEVPRRQSDSAVKQSNMRNSPRNSPTENSSTNNRTRHCSEGLNSLTLLDIRARYSGAESIISSRSGGSSAGSRGAASAGNGDSRTRSQAQSRRRNSESKSDRVS